MEVIGLPLRSSKKWSCRFFHCLSLFCTFAKHKQKYELMKRMMIKNYKGPKITFTSTGGAVQIQTLK
jgi:hypothetical protein